MGARLLSFHGLHVEPSLAERPHCFVAVTEDAAMDTVNDPGLQTDEMRPLRDQILGESARRFACRSSWIGVVLAKTIMAPVSWRKRPTICRRLRS